jgi:hypothetical protein
MYIFPFHLPKVHLLFFTFFLGEHKTSYPLYVHFRSVTYWSFVFNCGNKMGWFNIAVTRLRQSTVLLGVVCKLKTAVYCKFLTVHAAVGTPPTAILHERHTLWMWVSSTSLFVHFTPLVSIRTNGMYSLSKIMLCYTHVGWMWVIYWYAPYFVVQRTKFATKFGMCSTVYQSSIYGSITTYTIETYKLCMKFSLLSITSIAIEQNLSVMSEIFNADKIGGEVSLLQFLSERKR